MGFRPSVRRELRDDPVPPLDVQTGRYGSPFHAWKPLPFDVPTLPRVLAKAGYATQLVHDTPHLVNGGHNFDWPFHGWAFVRGAEVDRPWIDGDAAWLPNWALDPMFDVLGSTSIDEMDWRLRNYTAANRRREKLEDWNCARLFDTASSFLKDNASRDKFFLWIDCFDPHEPWDSPPEFVRMFDPKPGSDGRIDPRLFWRGPA